MISGGVSASRSASIPAPPLSFVRPRDYLALLLMPGTSADTDTRPVRSRALRVGGPGTAPGAYIWLPRPTRTPAPCRQGVAGSGGVFHADLHVHSRFSRACSKD